MEHDGHLSCRIIGKRNVHSVHWHNLIVLGLGLGSHFLTVNAIVALGEKQAQEEG